MDAATAKTVATLAYNNAIEQISQIQQRIVLGDMLCHEFGHDALPVQKFWRTLSSSQHDTLLRAAEHFQRERKADLEQLTKLRALVREMEQMFEKHHAEQDEAWATAMTDHIRKARKA